MYILLDVLSKTKGTKLSVYLSNLLDPTTIIGLIAIGLVVFITYSLFSQAKVDHIHARDTFAPTITNTNVILAT